MTRTCNFPVSQDKRCKQPIADGRPNCGRHGHNLSADQLFGRSLTVYRRNGALHIWAGKPGGIYCLIHNDPAYQVLCQLAGEVPPCCLREGIELRDEHGELHRDDGPALIWSDGTQEWWQHGERHRDDGPALIRSDGMQVWYQHGEQHRDGGPAITELGGAQYWCQHGERHRNDGPAEIWPGGTQHWYWHGKQVTEEEHARLREQSGGI
jgi:hypothetical protein